MNFPATYLVAAMMIVGRVQVSSCQAAPAASQPAAEKKQAAKASLSGCVTNGPVPGSYVLASDNKCVLLTGTFNGETLRNHVVTLGGELLPPSGMEPLRFKVQSVGDVLNACSSTCTLAPPGTRGLHPKEKPGSDGGPPGVAPPPPGAP